MGFSPGQNKVAVITRWPYSRGDRGRGSTVLCTYQCKPRGGGVRVRGGDLTKEQKFWSISRGWGSIRSSNVVKNPHLDISFQKHKLKSEYMPLL